MSAEDASSDSYIARVRLVGSLPGGMLKQLEGFRKGHHTVPDSLSPATQTFFARIIASRVEAAGEEWFQRAKLELKTKRRELTLEVTSPGAVLTAKDFVFEISYEMEAEDPGRFAGQQTLHDLKGERWGAAAFDRLFEGQFNEIVFDLARGVSVEEVIDAVEDLDESTGMSVDYPSDCSQCVLRVKGVDAEVCCDGHSLRMTFPLAGGPSELIQSFVAVREAFRLSKKTPLAGLLT